MPACVTTCATGRVLPAQRTISAHAKLLDDSTWQDALGLAYLGDVVAELRRADASSEPGNLPPTSVFYDVERAVELGRQGDGGRSCRPESDDGRWRRRRRHHSQPKSTDQC